MFWNAFVPDDGTSLWDTVPVEYGEFFSVLAEQSGDNSVTLPFENWRDAFIGDADFDRAQETYRMLKPEPFGLFVEKLDMKASYELTSVPRSYVLCHDDCALPPGDTQFGWLANARRLESAMAQRALSLPTTGCAAAVVR